MPDFVTCLISEQVEIRLLRYYFEKAIKNDFPILAFFVELCNSLIKCVLNVY